MLKNIIKIVILLFFLCISVSLFSQVTENVDIKEEYLKTMSEFTSGFLTLKENKTELLRTLDKTGLEYQIMEKNPKWIYFFIENDMMLEYNKFVSVLSIAENISVLYFFNAEDHGWGYTVLEGGRIAASVNISYVSEDLFYRVMNEAEKRYPNIDVTEEFLVKSDRKHEWQAIEDEIKISKEYKESIGVKINQMIENKNIHVFSKLGLNDDKVDELNILLSFNTLTDSSREFGLVNEFKSLLEIEDFNWLSYDYIQTME